MTRIDNSFGGPAQAETSAGRMPMQTGTFRGERAVVKDVQSVLADAAEEMSLYASEKVESKLSRRKVSADANTGRMRIEEITAYLEAIKALDDPKKQAQLVKQLLQAGGPPLRELLWHHSSEPTQQYALLQYALHEGEASGASDEVLERLQEAIADLEMESGPRIRAGINTIGIAAQSGDGIGPFQQTYRDVVLGAATLAGTLLLLLERLAEASGKKEEPSRNFREDLQQLIRAVGVDMSAARPSLDKTRLTALRQDLYNLAVFSTVLEDCEKLTALLQNRYGLKAADPVVLMKDLVAVTGEKWVSPKRFSDWADRWGIADVLARIAFFTHIKSILIAMPVQVFADDARVQLRDAAQHALDTAIELEDEEA